MKWYEKYDCFNGIVSGPQAKAIDAILKLVGTTNYIVDYTQENETVDNDLWFIDIKLKKKEFVTEKNYEFASLRDVIVNGFGLDMYDGELE